MRRGLIKNSRVNKVLISIFIILIVSFIIVSPQIYQKYIVLGHDVMFHFNRFYDLYRQIETGHFNYFQSNYGFDNSGRIINALYGYDSAFFQAILLYITKSWLKFQIISSFLCLVTSGITMYALSKKIGISNKFAVLSGILYMTSACVNYYVRYQAFTGWGAAFLPLIFIPAMYALQNKEKPINSIYLAIPVAILINVHIMSAVMGVLAIIPFYLVSFVQTKKKGQWIKDAFVAVLLVVLMSLNTLYSYYEVFSSNKILSPFISKSMFLDAFNLSITGPSFQKSAGVIFSIIFLITIAFSILNWQRQTRGKKVIDSVGISFLILSSTLLPWDFLANHFTFISIIQFPSRFSVIAYILLIISFFLNIKGLYEMGNDKIKLIIGSMALALTLLSVVSIHNIMVENAKNWQVTPLVTGDNKNDVRVESMEEVRNNFRSEDLGKALQTISKGTPDYLPISGEYSNKEMYEKRRPYTMYINEVIKNDIVTKKEVLKDGSISLNWKQAKKEEVILPIIIYNHSTVKINDVNLPSKNVNKTEIGSLKMTAKKGQNHVIVGYQPKIKMSIILSIKIVTVLSVFLYLIVKIIVTKFFFNN